MSISIEMHEQDYAYVLIDRKKKVISKSILNFDFHKEMTIKTSRFTTSGKTDGVYNAFPYFVSYGTKLIGIYSEGASHGDSDRQIMIVASKTSQGQSFSKVTFFENNTGVYDFSLLDGIVPDGGSLILKVWTITNTGGVFTATVNSTVSVGGISYSLWGDVVTTGGIQYRTGYSYVADNYNSALFTSSDSGLTWVYKSIIASGTIANRHLYNEAGLFYIGSGDFIAVVRDDYDGFGDGALYIVKSLDYGATWSTPILLPDTIRGRQPKLTRIFGTNNMALTIGKRTGTSGVNGTVVKHYGDRTGIQMIISTDYGDTWSSPTMIDSMYSTDGGQPWAVSFETGRMFIPYYARKSVEEEPDIYSVSINVAGLEL